MKKQYKTDKQYPPLNGAAIEQSWSNDAIARKIERYLNTCGLCLRVEEAEKFSQFDKITLGDVIWTLGSEENTQAEIITYFRRQLKIAVETF